jgi:hypothetical protein
VTSSVLVVVTTLLLLEAVRRRDAVLLAVVVFIAEHFVFRSVILRAGLDTPYPAYLFEPDSAPLMKSVDWVLIAWLAVLLVLSLFRSRQRAHRSAAMAATEEHSHERLQSALRLGPIAGVTLLMLGLLIASHGGLAGTQRFVRLGNGGEGGTGMYLAAPSILMVLSVTSIAIDRERRKRGSAIAWGALALSWLAFLILGSRTPIIASIVALGGGVLLRMLGQRRISMRAIATLVLVAVAVPQLAIGLRHLRDDALVTSHSATTQSATISQSINANYYDALALVRRDKGVLYGARSPVAVLDAATAVVPRAVWPSKPQYTSVGKWLRKEYEPLRINGWPIGAPGDWYITLAYGGVVLGAVASFYAMRLVSRRSRRVTAGTGYEIGLLWGFVVLPGGIDTEIISRSIVWILLPAIYVAVVRLVGDARKRSRISPVVGTEGAVA